MEAHRRSNIRDMNTRLREVQEQLEAEIRRGEAVTQALRARRERSIEEMNYDQLGKLKGSLEIVKATIAQNMSETSNPLDLFAATNSFNNNGGEVNLIGSFTVNRAPSPPTFSGPKFNGP
ncbi:uncharacterized protein LOC124924949 [Impatiens glandulifera]|uniref:uncharacterized protein LOC124924949 n=1 Tax=Impatiens glandulifera TaxID=253017 RepID=UPI001FB153EC|nr:uncharacterized protein LOC124924949 [Impatiens glandulifera]